jgi:uroporphyrinogen-III synthase
MARSLRGRRIIVTRAPDDARYWAKALAGLGARPVIFPCLSVVPIADEATRDALRAALAEADWLLLFSRRGAQITADLAGDAVNARVRIAVVGSATAEAARERFGRISLVPAITTAVGMADEIASIARASLLATPMHAVLAGAATGQEDAVGVLTAAGVRVTSVPVYRTIPAPCEVPRHTFPENVRTDILVASPSAVTGLLNRAHVPPNARVITIGPTTTAAARAAGLHVAAEARRPGLAGLLEVL